MKQLLPNLKYLRNKSGFTQQEFAEQLQVPRPTYSGWERGSAEPSIEILIRIASLHDISLDALLTDDLADNKYEVSKTAQMRVLAISLDAEGEENIELVETTAEAGYIESYKDPEFIKDLPKIKLPQLPVGTYRGFEISGDSMLPVEPGSIVIGSYVERLEDIKDGQTYIIATMDNGLVYKRLRKLDMARSVLATSDNMEYPPFEIRYDQISELWQFHAIIGFSDSRSSDGSQIENRLIDIQEKVDSLHHRMSIN